jgi:hypothetical protein
MSPTRIWLIRMSARCSLNWLPSTRGIRRQIHWHENPQYRFAPHPQVMIDPKWRAQLAEYNLLFEIQLFASQMQHAAELARKFPDTTFVLEHAGMLEDNSPDGWKRWREGMTSLAAQPNVNVKLSGLGTFVHACRLDVVGPIIKETVEILVQDAACLTAIFRSKSSGRTIAHSIGPFEWPSISAQSCMIQLRSFTEFDPHSNRQPGTPMPRYKTDIPERRPFASAAVRICLSSPPQTPIIATHG